MKISSVSKKVLASALSAAMVVAFAPTVALGSDLGSGTTTSGDKGTEAVEVTYYDTAAKTWKAEKFSANVTAEAYGNGIQGAFDFAAAKTSTTNPATVQLLGDITADVAVHGKVTVDLNGYTWTNAGSDLSNDTTADDALAEGPITVAAAGNARTTYIGSLIPVNGVNSVDASVVLIEALDQTQTNYTELKTSSTTKSEVYVSLVANTVYKIGDKLYRAKVRGAVTDFSGLYLLGVSSTTSAPAAGDLTIVDTSEAKTGKVDGNQVDVDAQGKKSTVAKAAIDATNGTLAIKGGTITTGAADLKVAGATALQVIKGTATTVENATIETVGGYYEGTVGTANDAHIGQNVEAVHANAVKNSTIKATAGDYGAQAIALRAFGNVESSTIEAVSGAGYKEAAGAPKVSTAFAIIAQGNGTYKKVAATATANGANAESKDAAGATTLGQAYSLYTFNVATTINSGSFKGDRLTYGTGSITLKGGEFSQHISTAVAGTLDANAKSVCLGEGKADYVYTKSAAANATYGDYATAVNTAIDHVYEAAIRGKDLYSVGYTLAEGYDAAALAAAVTDADEAANLKEYAVVVEGDKAATATAPAKLTADEEAYNEVVAATDEAAKAKGVVAYTYANLAAYVKYEKGATKKDVLSVTDLGQKDKAIAAGDSHVDGTTGLQANDVDIADIMEDSVFVTNTPAGMVGNTKSAVDVVAAGSELAKVEGSAKAGADMQYKVTKLGGYATVSNNGESTKSELEKLIEQLGGKVESGNATIAELTAQLAKLQDKDAVSKASNASKTVKLSKKSKTSASKTISLKAITSDSGAKVAYKKSSGSSMIKVSGTKATLKAGAKKGKTYTAKVKATVGASSKTITVKFVIK